MAKFDCAVLYTDGSSVPNPPGTGIGIYGYFYNLADFTEPAYRLRGADEAVGPKGFEKRGVAELPEVPEAVVFVEAVIPIPASTAQIAELGAFISCFKLTNPSVPHEADHYTIISDSAYMINSFTMWLEGWHKRNWTKADGSPCANLELIKRMWDIRQSKLDISMVKIEGHSGRWGNEYADTLAKQASAISGSCEGMYNPRWNVLSVAEGEEVDDQPNDAGEPLIDADALYGPGFIDIPDICCQRWQYMLADSEPQTTEMNGEKWYYVHNGNHAKSSDDIELVGKYMPDAMFSLTLTRRPIQCFNRIANLHEEKAWEGVPQLKRYHPIALINAELIKRKKFLKVSKNGFPVNKMKLSEDRNCWMYEDLILSRLLRPALLSYRTLTICDELLGLMRQCMENTGVVLTDITDLLFDAKRKPTKDYYRNVDRSIRMQVGFPDGNRKIPVVLAKGIDIPDRTSINRFMTKTGRFYVATFRPAPRLVRYATVYLDDNCAGFWMGYYSASRILTEEEAS